MLLYHGTDARYYDSVTKYGLRPRGTRKGCWDANSSIPGHVYLTDCYAGYFALNSAWASINPELMLIEIDLSLLDSSKLYPDEDFVQFAASDIPKSANKNLWVKKNIHLYQDFWEQSLKELGNIAYRGVIPNTAITRIARVFYNDAPEICMSMLDASITRLNRLYVGPIHAAYTKFLFGEKISIEDILPNEFDFVERLERSDDAFDEITQHFKARLEVWGKILSSPVSRITYFPQAE